LKMNVTGLVASQHFKTRRWLCRAFGFNIQQTIIRKQPGQGWPDRIQPTEAEWRIHQYEVETRITQALQQLARIASMYAHLQRAKLVSEGTQGGYRLRVGFHHLYMRSAAGGSLK